MDSDVYKLKTGDLVTEYTKFSPIKHPLSILSALIRIFQWISCHKWEYAKWNHSGIILKEGEELYVVDAISKGIVKRPLEEWLDPERKVWAFWRETSRISSRTSLAIRIRSYIGFKYDFTALFLHQLVYRLTFKSLWIGKTKGKAKDRLYCSEFYAMIWEYFEWWKMSTSDILQYSGLRKL